VSWSHDSKDIQTPHDQLMSAVVLSHVFASWDKQNAKNVLRSFSMSITEGKLCVIIGPVGSGKVDVKIV
jgi:ABC-type taurine transport system ATPase subunit